MGSTKVDTALSPAVRFTLTIYFILKPKKNDEYQNETIGQGPLTCLLKIILKYFSVALFA